MEILTADEVGAMLKLSKRSVYQLTCARVRQGQKHPLPLLRINGNLRFRKPDVEQWLQQLAEETA
jgi:hypothetical protein